MWKKMSMNVKVIPGVLANSQRLKVHNRKAPEWYWCLGEFEADKPETPQIVESLVYSLGEIACDLPRLLELSSPLSEDWLYKYDQIGVTAKNTDCGTSARVFLDGGFKYFCIFTSTWGNDPIWLIFFRWVETTYQVSFSSLSTPESNSSRAPGSSWSNWYEKKKQQRNVWLGSSPILHQSLIGCFRK